MEVCACQSPFRSRGCRPDRHCSDRSIRRARASCDTGRLQSRRAALADQAVQRCCRPAATASRSADCVQVLRAVPRLGLPRDHPSGRGAPGLSRASLRDARTLSALPAAVRFPARRGATRCAVSMPVLSLLSRFGDIRSLCGSQAVRVQGAGGHHALGACLSPRRLVRQWQLCFAAPDARGPVATLLRDEPDQASTRVSA